jgi:putative ABC transport system permease protein
VLQLVLGESVAISLLGGIGGLALGWLLVKGMAASPMNFGLTGLRWQAVLVVLVMAAVIGLFAALGPALIASRKNVVESLRFTG